MRRRGESHELLLRLHLAEVTEVLQAERGDRRAEAAAVRQEAVTDTAPSGDRPPARVIRGRRRDSGDGAWCARLGPSRCAGTPGTPDAILRIVTNTRPARIPRTRREDHRVSPWSTPAKRLVTPPPRKGVQPGQRASDQPHCATTVPGKDTHGSKHASRGIEHTARQGRHCARIAPGVRPGRVAVADGSRLTGFLLASSCDTTP